LGQGALGYINWAQATAYFPLRLVDVIGRVTFPLYSRLQGDQVTFGRSLERSVHVCAMGTLFFWGLGVGLGPNIVEVMYGDKWIPALPIFYVYVTGISIGFLSPLIAPALDALGKPQIMARLSIGWTVAICALVPFTTPLAARMGLGGTVGFAIGYCIPTV